MKKVLIMILAWFIAASFFYAAIWTNEINTLSECFMFTGFVAVGQILFTCVSYSFLQIKD